MIPAMGNAVSGLLEASNRASTAARDIVADGLAGATFSLDSMDAVASDHRAASAGSAAGPGGPAQVNALPVYIPSMAEDIVMMREAVQAYKANANVIRQLDRTTSELINVLRTDQTS